MRYIGVDLHKRLLVACVMEVEGGRRVVVARVPLPEIFADLGAESRR